MDETKKRGALLTTWLILMLIGNLAVALIYLLGGIGFISWFIPIVPFWAVYFGICFLNSIFAIFLFLWKKWAFFAFCGMSVITFILNLIVIKAGILLSLLGLSGPIILYLLMKPKWKLFK